MTPQIANQYREYFDLKKIIEQIKKYLPTLNEERFVQAFVFAEEAHRGQIRKDGKTPYIAHPIHTVQILSRIHADEDSLISAILHDVPEDTDKTIDDVGKLFGEKVSFLVDGITKLAKVKYKNNMPDRQVGSLKKMLLHSVKDARVILIKLADRLHNMSTLGNIKSLEKRHRIATETLEIYVPMAKFLGVRYLEYALEDLCFKHLFPQAYKHLSDKFKKSYIKIQKNLHQFSTVLAKDLQRQKVSFKIALKRHSLYEIYKKLLSTGKSIDDFEPRLDLKIIVDTIPQCYQVLGIMHHKFRPKNSQFQDNIAHSKLNGVRSLSTTVFGIDGLETKITILTKEMNIEAKLGFLAEFPNKKGQEPKLESKTTKWRIRIAEVEKNIENSKEFLTGLKSDVLEDRIHVYTPKGATVDLPKGSSVIDFAYAIHTEVGNKAVSAEINGKPKPILTILKPRDIIRVTTQAKSRPEASWLEFAKTSLAKNKIREYLKKASKKKKIQEGKTALQKQFDITGLGLVTETNFKKLNSCLQKSLGKSFKNFEKLFIAVGEGELKACDVMQAMTMEYRYAANFVKRKSKQLQEGYIFTIKIASENRFGLLKEISEVLYRHVTDMYYLKGFSSKEDKEAYFTTKILVKDLSEISKVFKELEAIPGITSVYRVSSRAISLLYLGGVFTALLWFLHPRLINVIHHSSFAAEYPLLSNFLIYLGIFGLLTSALFFTHIFKKYFPTVRNKKLLWGITFSIPILAFGLLMLEIFSSDLQLSIFVIMLEILLLYLYLGTSYKNFQKSRD